MLLRPGAVHCPTACVIGARASAVAAGVIYGLNRVDLRRQTGVSPEANRKQTFLIVDENDVIRDEGEAYARKLTGAGVRATSVRYNSTIHDFMMVNPLREAAAVTGAVE
jgi:acetyl esterase/lipase